MFKVFKLIVFLVFIFPFKLNGQVLNIDRENGEDSIKKTVKAAVTFSFSSDKQKKNLTDFTNTSEFVYFSKKNITTIFLSQIELSLNGIQIIKNNGFVQLRIRDNDTRKFFPDAYCQFQWNGILGMESRNIVGVNGRFNFFEKKKSDIYGSIGVFYENEQWNPFLPSFAYFDSSLTSVQRNLFRLNTSVKYAFKLYDKIDVSGSTFIQFPFNTFFNSPRWYFDTNVFFEINKHINFVLHYDHNIDGYRPLPIDEYYYNLTLGTQIKF